MSLARTNYPTLEQVERANQRELAGWMRFLPSPGFIAAGDDNFEEVFEAQKILMDKIIERFNGWTPELSKSVGW